MERAGATSGDNHILSGVEQNVTFPRGQTTTSKWRAASNGHNSATTKNQKLDDLIVKCDVRFYAD
jgi:hypothetical protein